jgi:hypothetical protein
MFLQPLGVAHYRVRQAPPRTTEEEIKREESNNPQELLKKSYAYQLRGGCDGALLHKAGGEEKEEGVRLHQQARPV